jgi:general secretion pathway protein D
MPRTTSRLLVLCSTLILTVAAGCQSLGERSAPQTTAATTPGTATVEATPPATDTSAASTERIASARQQILEMGSGEFIAPATTAPAVAETSAGDITLNFQDTDLREFVKAVVGDLLGANYLIDPTVAGKVTIHTARPIRRDDLLPLLEEVLAMNNTAIVQAGDGYRILPRDRAAAGTLAPSVERGTATAGYSLRVIPLQFIAAQEMQKILEPLISKGSTVRVDRKRNLLIASGTSQEVAVIQETVDIFDVDWLRGMSVGLYPLDYVDPKTLKVELDEILGAAEGGESKEMLGGLVRTVAIQRLSSILLISSTPAALREVEIWIHRLDRPGEHAGKRLYVYRVQNAKAVELADILSNIFGRASGAERPAAPELAPGLTPVQIGATGATAPEAAAQARLAGGGISLASGESVEIIADDVRNAVVVLATPQDYKVVEAAIERLDVVPLQVLIEASILEVTLRDDLNYGVEWFFKNSIEHHDGKEGRGTLDLGAAGLAALAPGFSYTIVDNADQVRLALNALAEESEINVLSSPSLMVLDNQTAMINVGDEIPVPTRQSVSTIDPAAPTVNEIEFRQTGVTLSVTPRVNESGLVTMEIKQEVSNAVTTTTSEIDAPTIQQRQIESVVAINTGETIVLGGLIQRTETASESGIPILYKIPVIGKFFGTTRDEKRRTELLVLITPRVVYNRDGAREITDEFRRKLEGLSAEHPG